MFFHSRVCLAGVAVACREVTGVHSVPPRVCVLSIPKKPEHINRARAGGVLWCNS